MTYVLQLAEDEHFALDVTLLRSLQFMMIKHELQKHPGSWRPGDIFVRNEATGEKVYQAPGADHVPDLMQELVDSLVETRRSSRVIRAAMAHLNLVMIHPFSDGNGRMARCLQTLVLARGGVLDPAFCSIEEYLGANTQEYYDVLGVVGGGDWNPERDASPWVRFVLTAHYRQATTLMRRQQELGLIWDDLEREISKRELPDRSLPLLSDACLGFSIRNVTYRKHADVSQVVASRDLNAITKSGLFEPHGEGRGRTYKATPELLAIRDRHRRKRPIPDPYELSDTVAAIGRER
jgi:Fic family protein